MRLVITDVGDGLYGASRAGGDISELVLVGGIPEPGALSLLGFGALALLRRRR